MVVEPDFTDCDNSIGLRSLQKTFERSYGFIICGIRFVGMYTDRTPDRGADGSASSRIVQPVHKPLRRRADRTKPRSGAPPPPRAHVPAQPAGLFRHARP
jgi:hypothetical protein